MKTCRDDLKHLCYLTPDLSCTYECLFSPPLPLLSFLSILSCTDLEVTMSSGWWLFQRVSLGTLHQFLLAGGH